MVKSISQVEAGVSPAVKSVFPGTANHAEYGLPDLEVAGQMQIVEIASVPMSCSQAR